MIYKDNRILLQNVSKDAYSDCIRPVIRSHPGSNPVTFGRQSGYIRPRIRLYSAKEAWTQLTRATLPIK